MTKPDDMAILADLHWKMGLFHAREAANTASWYCETAADTAKAANHFAVSAALRSHMNEQGEREDG